MASGDLPDLSTADEEFLDNCDTAFSANTSNPTLEEFTNQAFDDPTIWSTTKAPPPTEPVLDSLEDILTRSLAKDELKKVWTLLFGKELETIEFSQDIFLKAQQLEFELAGYNIDAAAGQTMRVVRVGILQNRIDWPTNCKITEQRDAIIHRISNIISVAGSCGVNVLCLQECWTSPFFMCTREKSLCEFAEDPNLGPSTSALAQLAKQHKMVIISPILERDENHGDQIFNCAVVISETGDVIGKTRKVSFPCVGVFSESSHYTEGDMGHAVFVTTYGKIGVNIGYGRHHLWNWMACGLDGAEIVFNPSATVGGLSEPLWPIEARNAAIANSYYACAINRVGVELVPNGDGEPAHSHFRHFYGSSYVAAPDGSRTPGLSRLKDGLLVVDCDLNLCNQARLMWGVRIPLYADLLRGKSDPNFQPHGEDTTS